MSLALVTAPTIEPLTLSQVKRHCRVSIDDDDDLVTEDLIPAVRDRCELVTGRQLVEATWDLRLDSFPCDGTIDVPTGIGLGVEVVPRALDAVTLRKESFKP